MTGSSFPFSKDQVVQIQIQTVTRVLLGFPEAFALFLAQARRGKGLRAEGTRVPAAEGRRVLPELWSKLVPITMASHGPS